MEDSTIDDFEGCSVIFRNVKEYYPTNQDLHCTFSVKENDSISKPENCFVGLFHVGWDSLESCIIKKSFSIVEKLADGLFTLDFSSNDIPESSVDEFYQFCLYESITDVVLGASCPFQICDLKQIESFIRIDSSVSLGGETSFKDDWWICGGQKPIDEDLDDSVLVHNKTTMLEDSLAKTVEENEVLKVSKDNFKSQLVQFAQEKQEYEKETEQELNMMQDKIFLLENQEIQFKQNLLESDKMINHLTLKMEKIHSSMAADYEKKWKEYFLQEKEVIVSQLNESMIANEKYSAANTELTEKFSNLLDKCAALEVKLASEKASSKLLESAYQEMVSSFHSKMELLDKEENDVSILKDHLKETEHRLITERKKSADLVVEAESLSTLLERFEQESREKDAKHLLEKNKLFKQIKEVKADIDCLTQQKESLENNLVCDKREKMIQAQRYEAIANELERKLIAVTQLLQDEKNCNFNKCQAFQIELAGKDKIINEHAEEIARSTVKIADLQIALEQEQIASKKVANNLSNYQEELKRVEEQKTIEYLSDSFKPHSADNGSRHALQVANAHMQKQLRNMRKQRDEYQKLYKEQQEITTSEDKKELERVNHEMKLRLCMGKKVYEEKYRECQKLKNEIANLKKNVSPVNDSQVSNSPSDQETEHVISKVSNENNESIRKLASLQKELETCKEKEQFLINDLEDLRKKSKKLAQHYEEKVRLLEEENCMIRKQKETLMKIDSYYPVSHSVIKEQPIPKSEPIIFHPPKSSIDIVERQPDFLGNIVYPPSFNIDDWQTAGAAPLVKKRTKAVGASKEFPEPPLSQVMDNRISDELSRNLEHCKTSDLKGLPYDLGKPTSVCPVCNLKFPDGYSTEYGNAHVNSHFT